MQSIKTWSLSVIQPPRTIAIVGAGFSGTVVAINLLQQPSARPVRVILLDRAAAGRGVAYAEREYPYLLNVPAGRMSADARDPLGFLKFARVRVPGATAQDFLPRNLYGEYLEARLREAENGAAEGVWLERISGTACSLQCRNNGQRYCLQLTDGSSIAADDLVLALGNPPSAALPGAENLLGSWSYVADPWSAPVRFRAGERVLVVGTGLTMADVVIAGTSPAPRDVHVYAISRHGLVPPSQSPLGHEPIELETRPLMEAASFSTRALFHAVRDLADDLVRRGGDWREVINHIRNLAPQLWQRLPVRERQRFLRHVRPYWDIHRHRLPHQTLAELEKLRCERKLTVQAGRILGLERVAGRVRVTWQPRGSGARATLLVDRVINCTGPNYDPRRSRDPLVVSLLALGLAVPDSLGLGVRTAAFGALLDARGRRVSGLYYVGPMLRPDHWESTAVPELREHASRLALHLGSAALKRTVAI
jgi:uncharacterized NAD(P)/FAD-binding protein YdhS